MKAGCDDSTTRDKFSGGPLVRRCSCWDGAGSTGAPAVSGVGMATDAKQRLRPSHYDLVTPSSLKGESKKI